MTKIKLVNRKAPSPILKDDGATPSKKPYRAKTIVKGTASGNDDYIDSQFLKPPAKIPTRSITLAILLCLAGSILLVLGILAITGHLDSRFEDRVWPMIIMGLLTFIPGAYHTRIFVCALKGVPGYSYEDIPEFE